MKREGCSYLMTCLGKTGDPPYHWTSALHSLSGTNTMSTPFSLLTAGLSFPPSAVRLVTLPALPPDDWRIRQALSMGPGRAGWHYSLSVAGIAPHRVRKDHLFLSPIILGVFAARRLVFRIISC